MSEPVLILFRGLPGIGKSTLAKQLQHELQFKLVVRDDIKEQLLKDGYDSKEIGAASYQVMWAKVKELLKNNYSCICDTNLGQRNVAAVLQQWEVEFQFKVIVLNCYCGKQKIHQKRFQKRAQEDLPSFFIKTWDEFQTYLQEQSPDQDFLLPYPEVKIDVCSEYSVGEVLQSIQQLLSVT